MRTDESVGRDRHGTYAPFVGIALDAQLNAA